MGFNIIPDGDALNNCAWYRNHTIEDMEVRVAGAKLNPDVDLSEYEGYCIQINLVSGEKPVYMMVTVEGSEAKKEGNGSAMRVSRWALPFRRKTMYSCHLTMAGAQGKPIDLPG